MKSEHTPGPWKIDKVQTIDHSIAISARNKKLVACAEHVDPCTATKEEKANARLIAAAPDLLQAAIDLLEDAEIEGTTHDAAGDERPLWKKLRQAIQKARG